MHPRSSASRRAGEVDAPGVAQPRRNAGRRHGYVQGCGIAGPLRANAWRSLRASRHGSVAAGAVLLRCLEGDQSPVGPLGVTKTHPPPRVPQINEIGHLTGKQTIAEFAENADIIHMLSSLGVDYAQGYGVA